MEDEPTFEQKPNDIGEGTTGDPSVLRPTEKAPATTDTDQEAAARDAGVLPSVWDGGAAADVKEAEQAVLPGEGIEIQPAGTVPSPELKPGDIGYTANVGSDSVITSSPTQNDEAQQVPDIATHGELVPSREVESIPLDNFGGAPERVMGHPDNSADETMQAIADNLPPDTESVDNSGTKSE